MQRLVSRALRREADGIIVHGEVLKGQVRRQPWFSRQRVRAIPHGVLAQPASMHELPDQPRVLFFGRAERYKGLDLFIRSVELAATQVPDLSAVVASHGPDLERCRSLVKRPELFIWRDGFTKDAELPLLFAMASAVVAPYRDASQSGVIPLAFANGRPVVVTPVGSLPESVQHGVNGRVAEEATVQSIANAIADSVRDRTELQQMAEAALATAQTGALSAKRIASLHLDFYREILHERGDRRS